MIRLLQFWRFRCWLFIDLSFRWCIPVFLLLTCCWWRRSRLFMVLVCMQYKKSRVIALTLPWSVSVSLIMLLSFCSPAFQKCFAPLCLRFLFFCPWKSVQGFSSSGSFVRRSVNQVRLVPLISAALDWQILWWRSLLIEVLRCIGWIRPHLKLCGKRLQLCSECHCYWSSIQ